MEERERAMEERGPRRKRKDGFRPFLLHLLRLPLTLLLLLPPSNSRQKLGGTFCPYIRPTMVLGRRANGEDFRCIKIPDFGKRKQNTFQRKTSLWVDEWIFRRRDPRHNPRPPKNLMFPHAWIRACMQDCRHRRSRPAEGRSTFTHDRPTDRRPPPSPPRRWVEKEEMIGEMVRDQDGEDCASVHYSSARGRMVPPPSPPPRPAGLPPGGRDRQPSVRRPTDGSPSAPSEC